MAPSVVLIVGVSRFLGSRLARLLAATPGVTRVIGVDREPLPASLHWHAGWLDFFPGRGSFP